MKKVIFLKRTSVLFLGFILGSFTIASSAEYCHSSITSNRGATAYVTMKSLGGNNYQFIFESEENIVSWNKTGSNFYANVNGIGGYQVSNNLTLVDAKTLSVTITSTSKPTIYVGAFYVNYANGEHMFSIPMDGDFDAICPGGGASDETAPVMGSASVAGTPGYNSVTLLLGATDDVTNPVTKFVANDATNSITDKALTADALGNAVLSGLSPSTVYNLTITAKDAAGNVSANSATVSFSTTENTSNECSGSDNVSVDGESFVNGYSYSFTTSGTDVTITVELLDAKTGLMVYLWNRTNGFVETGMTISSGQTYTATLTGQTVDSDITVAVKFAYAGGMAVTRDFVYTVGETCVTTVSRNSLPIESVSLYPNPVQDNLRIASAQEISQIEVKNLLGQTLKTTSINSKEGYIELNGVSAGNYFVTVVLSDGRSLTQKIIKK
jgi:hypothetical protein